MTPSSQEVRRLPGLRVSDQADPSYPGTWAEQGRQVPLPAHPQRESVHQGGRGQIHHQIPDEEGTFSRSRIRKICFSDALMLNILSVSIKVEVDCLFIEHYLNLLCCRCSVWLWL